MSGYWGVDLALDDVVDDTLDKLTSFPELTARDIEALLAILVGGKKRVEKVVLSSRTVWIKRYGTEKPTWWRHLQTGLSRLIPSPCLRPSPYLSPAEMAERERRRIRLFEQRGVAAPKVLYSSRGAMVLVACASELGRLHGAGLCHGRRYPRDMFFAGNRLGFMDFEEEPQTVMPLETAQARDLWLLFLQIASNARLGQATYDRAYAAWKNQAPAAAIADLGRLTGFLGRFLSLARLIGRLHMGSDLQRFIVATGYLTTVSLDDR
jgi:hypothetical protein